VLLQDKRPDCGCTLNTAATNPHNHPAATNKQKDISLKTDWKFVQQQHIRLTPLACHIVTVYHRFSQPLYHAYYKSIFHPPGLV
jgi:hypothetical protein